MQQTQAVKHVNGGRLWGALMELARIGATAKGGVRRVTLTDVDRQGRDLFARWCREAGMDVRVDGFGNMFARRAGAEEYIAIDYPAVASFEITEALVNAARYLGLPFRLGIT